MANIFIDYPPGIQKIIKQKLCLPALFDGQYRKRNFIINCSENIYRDLLKKYENIKNFIQHFLYDVQDRSENKILEIGSPLIIKKTKTFLRNITIINSCNLKIFSINYNDFPEIKENEVAYNVLLNEFSRDQIEYINEFCHTSEKYGLYIYDLLSPCDIELEVLLNNRFKNEDYYSILDNISEDLYYYPYADPSNTKRIAYIPDPSKMSNAQLKHYYNIANPLSEGKIVEESEQRKVQKIFTGSEKFSISLNSIKSRWIGLWMWDQCYNPLKKEKDFNDILLEAIKFRFDTEPEYKEKFLERNGLTSFPNKIDTNMDYFSNEVRNMRKIMTNTNESIKKMKIIPLRIETDKQKEEKKLKKSLGI